MSFKKIKSLIFIKIINFWTFKAKIMPCLWGDQTLPLPAPASVLQAQGEREADKEHDVFLCLTAGKCLYTLGSK